jgi:hypothetical protein
MRFESSIAAFKSTLDNFIANHELIVAWWDKFGYIPVYKKGNIPDPQNLELVASDEELNDELSENELKRILASPKLTKDVKRGLILIPKGLMKQEFITKVKSDIVLLKKFKADWFKDNVIREDPKLDNITSNLVRQIKEDKNRKIVIFTAYTDTADYVYKHLIEKGLRVFEYTGASASTANKEVVMSNFDAGLEISRQNNDYDILVATDAISEGYNLHRAGIIYNYDIPYNPVRVVQRVGRINRINKKVFDKLYIYNSFPTAIGESEVQTKRISTLKVHLMNTLYGSDTKVLTEAEKLESYFIDNYNEEVIREESESWDAKYRNIWDKLKYDKTLVAEVTDIKQRSFLARKKDNKGMLLFGQKGKGASIFATNVGRENMSRVSAEEVLVYFEATKDEKSVSKTADFRAQFDIGKSKLFKKDQLPDNKGRRGDAITVLNLMIQDTNDTKIIAHAKDARRVITDLDGFPEGTLKRIIDISKSYLKDGDYEGAFKELVSIAPEDYIEGINLRALNFEKEPEALLIAEELL